MINHNGKTYYPDANGWYPIECLPANHFHADSLMLTDGEDVAECVPDEYTERWFYLDYPDCVNFYEMKATHFQFKPKPPVTLEAPNEIPQ